MQLSQRQRKEIEFAQKETMQRVLCQTYASPKLVHRAGCSGGCLRGGVFGSARTQAAGGGWFVVQVNKSSDEVSAPEKQIIRRPKYETCRNNHSPHMARVSHKTHPSLTLKPVIWKMFSVMHSMSMRPPERLGQYGGR
jgi:hypothetical protein